MEKNEYNRYKNYIDKTLGLADNILELFKNGNFDKVKKIYPVYNICHNHIIDKVFQLKVKNYNYDNSLYRFYDYIHTLLSIKKIKIDDKIKVDFTKISKMYT